MSHTIRGDYSPTRKHQGRGMCSMLCTVILLLVFPKGVSTTASSCPNCTAVSVTCVDGECLPRCVNVKSSGDCLQCRDSRFYGTQCENDCPNNCLNSRCQLNVSRVVCTEGCVEGKKGDNCAFTCSRSCTHCERYGAKCIGPCRSSMFYGDWCNKSCPYDCRGGCNVSTGVCNYCFPGYRSDQCNVSCPATCTNGCDRVTGACNNCTTGHIGKYCNLTCLLNCICDRGTTCDSCKSGYRGTYCDESCPSNCTICDRYKNICIGPCPTPNVYGDDCSIPCPYACNGCDKTSGMCNTCATGYNRTYCDEMCSRCTSEVSNCNSESCIKRVSTTASSCPNCTAVSVTCVDGECLPRCVNVKSSGDCLQCRDSRFYGTQCENDCPNNCLNSRCQLNVSRVVCTEGCVEGKKGDNCAFTCSKSCTHCERYGAKCIGPCRSSMFYGDWCNKSCPYDCRGGCNVSTGVCNYCFPGYRSDQCNVSCPSTCTNGCDRVTGECYNCTAGHIGKYCNLTCLPNCICDRGTTCDSCKSGYRGTDCDEHCPSNCTICDRYKNICIGPCPTPNVYGDDCSIPCPYACNGCDKTSGVCNTCATGYSRTYCDEMCSRCTSEISNCNSKSCIKRTQLIMKIVFGVLAVVLVVATVLIVYKHRRKCVKRNRQQKPRVESNYSDQTQYWSTKYWEIKDEDMESDSSTNRGLPPRQELVCPAVSFREEIPLQGEYETVRDQQPTGESCPTASVLAHAYSVLENTLYKSSGASAACASRDQDMAGVSTSLDLSDEDVQTRGHRRLIWTDKDGSEVSVTSEDLRLTRKTDSMLLWEQNTDFSQVYVKYITPNSPACK